MDAKLLINLKKDGSGTIEQEMAFSKAMMDQLASFGKMLGAKDDTKQPSAEDKKKEAKERLEKLTKRAEEMASTYGEGVQLVSAKEEEEGRLTKTVFSFKDINKVKLTGLFSQSRSAEKDTPPITFHFEKGKTSSKLTINNERILKKEKENKEIKKAEEVDKTPSTADTTTKEEMTPEQLKAVKSFFDGMKLSMFVKVDGQIESSNATYLDKENSEITLLYADFGKLVNNSEFIEFVQKFDKNKSKDPFSLDPALKDKFPEIKAEPQGKITVEFK